MQPIHNQNEVKQNNRHLVNFDEGWKLFEREMCQLSFLRNVFLFLNFSKFNQKALLNTSFLQKLEFSNIREKM